MKTFNSILFFVFSLFMLISCNNEARLNEGVSEQVIPNEQGDLKVLKNFSKYVTKEIYLHAYDKETGEVDIEKYDEIILSYKLDKDIDLSNSFKQPILTRGSNELYETINSSEFTEKQREVFKELLDIEKPTLDDYHNLKFKVFSWNTDDKYLVIQTIDNIISIIEGIQEGLNDINVSIQSRGPSRQSYMCNLGVSMISGVTGFLAGALTATTGAGPLIGYVVGGAVGTYLGANMC